MEFLVHRAMCALMPPAAGLPGFVDTDPTFVARLHRESDLVFWLGILGGAFVFTVTPLLTIGVPLPSFLLPARLLDRHALRICTTRIYLFRQAVFLLKMAAGMGWGQDPVVRAKLGLDPLPPDPGTWRTT